MRVMFADRSRQGQRFVGGWENDCLRPQRLLDAQAAILCRRTDHHQFGWDPGAVGQIDIWPGLYSCHEIS